MKTKLGITAGLFGAGLYFGGFFGGLFTSIILLGYVLLFEENEWLRVTAIKATVLTICFSIVLTVLDYIPDFFNVLDGMFMLFNNDFNFEVVNFINKLVYFIRAIILFVKNVLFIILGMKALSQGSIAIGFVDNIIQKHYRDVK